MFGSPFLPSPVLSPVSVTDLQDCILHGLLIGEGGTLCELKWGGDRQDGCLVFSLDEQGQNRHFTSHSLLVTVERMAMASCPSSSGTRHAEHGWTPYYPSLKTLATTHERKRRRASRKNVP